MSEEEMKALVEMKDMLKAENTKLKQDKQELIDKIKEISLGEIDEAYLEERKMSERIEDVLDLIKEYEDE